MTMEYQISYVMSSLYFILRSTDIVKNILIKLKFTQFMPIYVPKNLLNASAQVLTHPTNFCLQLAIATYNGKVLVISENCRL